MVESKIEPRVLELLRQLEDKHNVQLVKVVEDMEEVNHRHHFDGDRSAVEELDSHANVNRTMVNYQSALRYLCQDSITTCTTVDFGTRKYTLSGRQKISFYPELWFENELEASGQYWAIDTLEKNHA